MVEIFLGKCFHILGCQSPGDKATTESSHLQVPKWRIPWTLYAVFFWGVGGFSHKPYNLYVGEDSSIFDTVPEMFGDKI